MEILIDTHTETPGLTDEDRLEVVAHIAAFHACHDEAVDLVEEIIGACFDGHSMDPERARATAEAVTSLVLDSCRQWDVMERPVEFGWLVRS